MKINKIFELTNRTFYKFKQTSFYDMHFKTISNIAFNKSIIFPVPLRNPEINNYPNMLMLHEKFKIAILSALNFNTKQVKIVEVGLRDGLQNEKVTLDYNIRAELVEDIVNCGFEHLEIGSFVSQKVQTMRNSDKIMPYIKEKYGIKKNIKYSGLVANKKYAEKAIQSGVTEIAVFTTVSNEFSKKNVNCNIDESLNNIKEITDVAKYYKIPIRGYISCVFGCPYEGYTLDYIDNSCNLAKKLMDFGCYEISIADTIGFAKRKQVGITINKIINEIPKDIIAVHFHDTCGKAIENIDESLKKGITIIDSSINGLGGCPYANGAPGNVSTQDVIQYLNMNNINHGIDEFKLYEIGEKIKLVLNKENQNKNIHCNNK